MLKLGSSRVDAPTKTLFPWPENLLNLEQQYAAATSVDERTAMARQFTQTVAALRVGHICKTTRWSRLDRSLSILETLLNPLDEKRILDIGVSDGITTYEAIQRLSRQGNATVSALGIDLHNELVRYQRGWIAEYRSNNGDPVLAQLGPFLITVGAGASPRQPVSRWIADTFLKFRTFREGMRSKLRISLINPLARECPQATFQVQNIFERRDEWQNRFTLVRAANVLNPDYFSEPQIVRAIDHLFSYLKDGGILLISRNLAPRESPNMEEHGSIWSKTLRGFEPLAQIGRGSCVAELVNRYRQSEQRQFS